MAEVRLSTQAEKDLDAVLAYYDEVAPDFSEVFESNLLAKLRLLEDFPRMGRRVPEIGDDALREVIYRSYRVIYHVDADDEVVEVLTLLHGSREFGG